VHDRSRVTKTGTPRLEGGVARLTRVVLGGPLALWFAIPAGAQVLGTEINLTPSTGVHEYEPALAAAGETVVAVWSVRDRPSMWSVSLDAGTSWSAPAMFPLHVSNARIEGNVSVCATYDGQFFFASKYSGSRLSVWRGSQSSGGLSWSLPTTARTVGSGQGYLMPSLAYDNSAEVLYLAFTETSIVGNPPDFQARILFTRSLDAGATWSAPVILSEAEAGGSRVATGPDGEVYVVWQDYSEESVLLRRSLDHGVTFEPPRVVSRINDNVATGPPWYRDIGSRPNPRYDECTYGFPTNRPGLAIDHSTGPYRGRLYVVWAEMATGTPGPIGPAMVNREPNEGYFQAQPITIGQTIDGYVVPDERGGSDFDYFSFEGVQGQTIVLESEVTFIDPQPPPIEEGQCFSLGTVCDTTASVRGTASMREVWRGPLPPVVLTLPESRTYYLIAFPQPPYVSGYQFRLRSFMVDPSSIARDQRDIVLVSSADGGDTWSSPLRVNDDPPWHDNSYPQVAVDSNGGVHCAWYDRRHDTSCDRTTLTYWALSRDGGRSFAESGPVSQTPSDWRKLGVPTNVGDGFGLTTGGESVYVAWTQSSSGSGYDIHAVPLTVPPVPVSLFDFSFHMTEGQGYLRWRLLDSEAVIECRVEKQSGDSNVEFLDSGRSTAEPGTPGGHEFIDPEARPGDVTSYRIRAVLRTGSSRIFGPFSVQWVAPGASPKLEPFHPNPFRGEARARVLLTEGGLVEAVVFDVQGRAVRTLVRRVATAGETELVWDGLDNAGASLPPGNYFIRMTAHGETQTRRVTLRR
jgi:hypothetical protein